MAKRQGKTTYVFAVGMRNAPTRGRFEIKGLPADAAAEVLGEGTTDQGRKRPFRGRLSGRMTCIFTRSRARRPDEP